MKRFAAKEFCDDLAKLIGKESKQSLAEKLGIDQNTLSLLEEGKQIPSLDIFDKICDLGALQAEDYFREYKSDALFYLMGSLEAGDKNKLLSMMNRIRIKEKYEMLARGCVDGID